MNDLQQRWRAVHERMAAACVAAGRDPGEVTLLAVGKQHPASALRALHGLGQRAFGENRVPEALGKQDALADLAIEWHFIGPVQSNKTRDLAARFQWVQSVDRDKILRRLADQRPEHAGTLNLCLQVNIDREPQKSGVDPDRVEPLAALAAEQPRLRLRGLMCLPRAGRGESETRRSFARLRELQERLRSLGHDLDTLSMGMSGDLEWAIAEGSTMIRIGTDLFGPRPDRQP
ncbi:MAG: YggS family pyridoxal phosphate-dependent enzyme [Gammaproteobacteria bacterium]